MTSVNDFKRFIALQQKYGILYESNADLNERFTKLEAKYDKLIKAIIRFEDEIFDSTDFHTTFKLREIIKEFKVIE